MNNDNLETLNDENVKNYFSEVSSLVYENSKILEDLENWIINENDYQSFWQSINAWAAKLQELKGTPDILFEEEEYKNLAIILAYIPASKALKILSLASKIQPGVVGDLALFCKSQEESSAEQKLFLKRLRFVIKLESYNRVFNPERRKEILRILKKRKEEENNG